MSKQVFWKSRNSCEVTVLLNKIAGLVEKIIASTRGLQGDVLLKFPLYCYRRVSSRILFFSTSMFTGHFGE